MRATQGTPLHNELLSNQSDRIKYMFLACILPIGRPGPNICFPCSDGGCSSLRRRKLQKTKCNYSNLASMCVCGLCGQAAQVIKSSGALSRQSLLAWPSSSEDSASPNQVRVLKSKVNMINKESPPTHTQSLPILAGFSLQRQKARMELRTHLASATLPLD